MKKIIIFCMLIALSFPVLAVERSLYDSEVKACVAIGAELENISTNVIALDVHLDEVGEILITINELIRGGTVSYSDYDLMLEERNVLAGKYLVLYEQFNTDCNNKYISGILFTKHCSDTPTNFFCSIFNNS